MTSTLRLTKAQDHMLDRPVWSALSTKLRAFSHAKGQARMMKSCFGPFAGAHGDTEQDQIDFARLIEKHHATVATLDTSHVTLTGCDLQQVSQGVQMIAGKVDAPSDRICFSKLTLADAADIHALAEICKPGPFAPETYLLGTFIGLRRNGVLIAMAGQRLRMPGFTEISAVCVAPDYRGLGLGTETVRAMAALILEGGDTPFLHAYANNVAAINLYAKLGFEVRTHVQMRRWAATPKAIAA